MPKLSIMGETMAVLSTCLSDRIWQFRCQNFDVNVTLHGSIRARRCFIILMVFCAFNLPS